MKPVYEAERRSSRSWVVLMCWAFGIFLALSFAGMVVAQVAVQLTPAPIAVAHHGDAAAVAAPAAPAVKWEYKVAGDRQRLAELGKEGWELVAVTQPVNGAPTFYLKRPWHGAAAADHKRGAERHSGHSESHDIRETPEPEINIR